MGRKLANTKQKFPQPINPEGGKVIKLRFKPQPKSESQRFYLESLYNSTLTIGTGPAGSGKSFLTMAVAVDKLLTKEVSKIVITRPIVESGEKLGFLPGTFEEKISPYLLPLLDALEDLVGPTMAKKLLENGMIEFAPLAYMRGRSFHNCLPADHTVRLVDGSVVRLDEIVARFQSGEKLEALSFNTCTGKIEAKPIVAAFGQPNQHGKLVKVTLDDGTVIFATPDHKLYSEDGMKPVNQLNIGDSLMVLDDVHNDKRSKA